MRWPWQRKAALSPVDLALELLRESASKTGLRVTWETVLQASTALACARVIAEGIAQPPLKLLKSLGEKKGAKPATEHPLYALVDTGPNPWLTSFEWLETAGLHLAVGNRSYAYINRAKNVRAESIEILPLTPQQVRAERGDSYAPRYHVTFKAGMAEQEVAPEKILHLRGPSWNGWEGLDGVRLAREAVGLALATEEHGSRLFKNGTIVGGILSTEQDLKKEARDALRESWDNAQSGLQNAYRTALLWGGLKWMPRGMQNDQAQWVEVRRFQVLEVCRFYRVLPIMVGEADKTATYASSEQMFLAHVVHTMGPWYRRLEQRFNLQLLTEEERKAGYYFKFNVNALMRGAFRDRAEFYRVLHGIGALNPNEIRELEDMNPYDEGNTYLQPLNMVPAGTPPAEPPARGNGNGAADEGKAHDRLMEVMTAAVAAMSASASRPTSLSLKVESMDAAANEIAQAVAGFKANADKAGGALERSAQASAAASGAIVRSLNRLEESHAAVAEAGVRLGGAVEELARVNAMPRKVVEGDDGRPIGTVPVKNLE